MKKNARRFPLNGTNNRTNTHIKVIVVPIYSYDHKMSLDFLIIFVWIPYCLKILRSTKLTSAPVFSWAITDELLIFNCTCQGNEADSLLILLTEPIYCNQIRGQMVELFSIQYIYVPSSTCSAKIILFLTFIKNFIISWTIAIVMNMTTSATFSMKRLGIVIIPVILF